MTLTIVNNVPALNAHRNLLSSDKAINKSLEKISTGLNIVRASDGPADLIISEQLRSQISGLKQATQNAETAVSVVQTTEAAMEELNRLLIDLRKLAVHASNDGANDKLMLEADQQEVNYIMDSINRIAEQTSFGTRHLLDGSSAARGVAIGEGLEFVEASTTTMSSGLEGYDVRVDNAGTKATLRSQDFDDQEFARDIFVPGEEKMVTVAQQGRSAVVEVGAGTTIDLLVTRLNNEFKANNMGLTAFKDLQDEQKIILQSNEYGDGNGFTATSTVEGLFGAPNNLVQAIDGTDIEGTIGVTKIIGGREVITKYAAEGEGNVLTGLSGSPIEGLAVRYDSTGLEDDPETPVGKVVMSQNALAFQVGADYGQYLKFDLASTYAKDLANGIDNDSGYRSIADIDLRTFQGAQDALKLVVGASNDISSMRGKLGALQKNSLEPTVSYVRNLTENMTASESVIRDADIAEETAALIRKQIQAQTSAAAQVHASNSPRVVQSLLSAITP
ncbi:MAG: flagellin [SAR324 cluster bacterium]|nr:flagellin [SAR324 cluster bacterium]